jgi:hypothetical protein
MRVLFVLITVLALHGCAVTPPEPPEPIGEYFPINKPALSAVEVNELKPEPVKKKRKHRRNKVRHVK